jgi:hypothetical protein
MGGTMKRLFWMIIFGAMTGMLGTTAFSAQVYNYFSPGCALSGNATSQTINLASGACVTGVLPASNLVVTSTANYTISLTGSTCTSTPAAVAVKFVRIGTLVTVYIPPVTCSASGSGVTGFVLTGTPPSSVTPATSQVLTAIITTASGAGTPFTGVLTIDPSTTSFTFSGYGSTSVSGITIGTNATTFSYETN